MQGSTRKIYRQKGTGRARHGSIRASTFVGGGTAFGPKPRSYDKTPPKKVRAGALRSALSLRVGEKKLLVLAGLRARRDQDQEGRRDPRASSAPSAA